MKKLLLFLAVNIIAINVAFSQGAAINTSGNIADTSAILDVSSTNKGMLIPRMTTLQRNAIVSPAKGLQIYNTDCDNFNYNAGTPAAPNWVPANPLLNLPSAAGIISGSASVCQGQNNVSYSVPAIANATSYTWAYSGTGATISGSTNPMTINFSGSAIAGNLSVMGSNACGNGTVSANYPVTINANLPVSVSIAANPAGAICLGTSVTFTAIPINGGSAPSYQWKNGSNIVGSNSSTYTSTTLANGDVISCVMTSNITCVTGSPATSNTITMTVNTFTVLNPPTVYNGKQVFSYTGVNQTYTVSSNACATKIFVKMWGAGGGGATSGTSGSGAFVSGYLNVTPGSTLTVIVGGGGIHTTQTNTSDPGGFGGGGASGKSANSYFSGSGGGRSAIQITLGSDAATAGGGGGGGSYTSSGTYKPTGGGGGAPNGGNGGTNISSGFGGQGGTLVAGGTGGYGDVTGGAGSSLTGGIGANSSYSGGGGGGGYYGGGGGGASSAQARNNGGGGGGSSFTSNLTTVINTVGGSGSTIAPNNSDVDYVTGVGMGATTGYDGGTGEVVIYW